MPRPASAAPSARHQTTDAAAPLLLVDTVSIMHAGAPHPSPSEASLQITRGEVVLLLGPSGSGKSTLALALDGLIPHAVPATLEGTIEVSGLRTADATVAQLSPHVAMVFQDPDAQLVTGSLLDEVAFGPENLRVPVGEVLARAENALRRVGLWERRHDNPDVLSGGGRQRLAIATALAMGSPLLVLDEPTANLDPRGIEEVYATLADVVANGERSILLIEHNLDAAIGLVDRVVVLDQRGRVAADGPLDAVLRDRAEELRQLGVWLPTATLAALRLRRAGYVFDPLPLNPEELRTQLAAQAGPGEAPEPGGRVAPEARPPGGAATPDAPHPGDAATPDAPHPGDAATPDAPHPGGRVAPEARIETGEQSRATTSSGEHPGLDTPATRATRPPEGDTPATRATRPPEGDTPAARATRPPEGTEHPGLAVEVRGLTLSRGRTPVLHDVSLEIERGEFVAIVGANGAGKTSLLQAIAGVLPPPRGTVRLGEGAQSVDVARADARTLPSRIGFVFQNPEHQFITHTVFDEIAHGLRRSKLDQDERRRRVDDLLDRFGLTDKADVHPFLLSGGQKRRLSVGTALVAGAPILALDEPTFGQDRARADELLRLLSDLNSAGTTIIVVTHDMQLVAEYADRVVVVDSGRIAASGTARDVLADTELLERCGLRTPPLRQALRELPQHPDLSAATRLRDLPGGVG